MPCIGANRLNRMQSALALCGTLALSACGARYAQVPARLNLHPYGRVALLSFYSDESNRNLSTLATQQFAEALLASQPGIELLEVNATSGSPRDLTVSADSATLARALGHAGGKAPAVFVGRLTLSGVKPRAGLGGSSGVNVSADVRAELTVRLLTTDGAATVWRSSAAGSRKVGQVALSGRLASIGGRDPNAAYGEMVRELVADVTRDLRPTLVKQ
jgi:hypothetical protein